MDRVPLGKQVTKTLKFRGPPYPQFTTAPLWDITNESGMVVLSGSSIISITDPNGWDVTFTFPINYQTENSDETMTLEVYGNDSNGVLRSVDYVFNVLDAADDFLPSTVLAQDMRTIKDSVILEASTYTSENFKITIKDYLDKVLMRNVQPTLSQVYRVANLSDVPNRFTEHEFRGYRYDLEIPGLKFPKLTRAPYQMYISVDSASFEEIHPVVRLNGRWNDFIISLKAYLDKARLIEIDPTLQWRQEEFCVSLMEGLNYINAHPTVYTFWTIDDVPLPMKNPVIQAAALHALNSRYMAEGFNAFEFQGLSTSLTMDRRDTITYKIEEIKSYLETNLTMLKSNAIATFGKGTPDVTVTSANKEARAIVRVQNSPARNVYGYAYTYQASQLSRFN